MFLLLFTKIQSAFTSQSGHAFLHMPDSPMYGVGAIVSPHIGGLEHA